MINKLNELKDLLVYDTSFVNCIQVIIKSNPGKNYVNVKKYEFGSSDLYETWQE